MTLFPVRSNRELQLILQPTEQQHPLPRHSLEFCGTLLDLEENPEIWG